MKVKNKNKRDVFFSKKTIQESISYIKESKNYIYLGFTIFFLSSFITFVFAERFSFLDKIIADILLKADNKEGFYLFLFIFLNNLSVAFYNVFTGLILGVFPLLNSIINGGVIGYVFQKVYYTVGPLELWRILPHGIFELPAIFIAIGLGIKNGFFFLSKRKGEFKRRLYSSLKVFVFIILPLLILAAIIETLLIIFVE